MKIEVQVVEMTNVLFDTKETDVVSFNIVHKNIKNYLNF